MLNHLPLWLSGDRIRRKKHLNDTSKISQQKKEIFAYSHFSKGNIEDNWKSVVALKVTWVFEVKIGVNLPFLLQYPVNDQAKGHPPQLLLNLRSCGHLLTLLLCPEQLLQLNLELLLQKVYLKILLMDPLILQNLCCCQDIYRIHKK